jgi:hypothetical protein
MDICGWTSGKEYSFFVRNFYISSEGNAGKDKNAGKDIHMQLRDLKCMEFYLLSIQEGLCVFVA